MLVNSLGRKWEFTFTTLVTFGGAFFASFPLFYSTSFGGAFYVWMAILLLLRACKPWPTSTAANPATSSANGRSTPS